MPITQVTQEKRTHGWGGGGVCRSVGYVSSAPATALSRCWVTVRRRNQLK
jgi:hypothetical protein